MRPPHTNTSRRPSLSPWRCLKTASRTQTPAASDGGAAPPRTALRAAVADGERELEHAAARHEEEQLERELLETVFSPQRARSDDELPDSPRTASTAVPASDGLAALEELVAAPKLGAAAAPASASRAVKSLVNASNSFAASARCNSGSMTPAAAAPGAGAPAAPPASAWISEVCDGAASPGCRPSQEKLPVRLSPLCPPLLVFSATMACFSLVRELARLKRRRADQHPSPSLQCPLKLFLVR